VELKLHKGARYQIGVLQAVDLSLPDHSIEEIEGWWKRKLMSREHGLNRNLHSSYASSRGPARTPTVQLWRLHDALWPGALLP
jgi:hypothetical protein